jgi:hypothetical protein
MIRIGLSVVAAAGLVIGGWAIAGENCHKGDAASHVSAGGCGGKVQLSEAAIKALNENAAYKRADELLKSWSEVPAKFVAMSEEDKTFLASTGQKMAEHPSAAVMKPSFEFVRASLRTAVQIDRAAQEMVAAQCKLKAQAAAGKDANAVVSAVATEAPKVCPKMAAAKLRMEESAGLVAKASYLISVASKTTSHRGAKDDSTHVKAVSEEGCPHAKAAAVAAAATQPSIVLTAAKAKEEAEKESCPIARAAKLAAIAAAAATQPAIVQVKAEGEKFCPKSLAAKADALIGESGKILAQWQEAGVVLASMDESARTTIEASCAGMMSRCPAGRLMPATLSTARELLVEASKITAQCQAECAKNTKMQPSAEMKELMQARCLLISAAINVLDRTCTIAKPAKQIASAQ